MAADGVLLLLIAWIRPTNKRRMQNGTMVVQHHALLLRLALFLLLRRHLALLLLLNGLTLLLLLLWGNLALFLLLRRLALLLLLNRLPLFLLLRSRLTLLLLRSSLIVRLQRRRSPHVAIGRKRLADRKAGRTAMIDTRKLSPIGAGGALILHLRRHGRGMGRTQRRQFRGSCSHLHSARSAVEADAAAAPVAAAAPTANRPAIDVALDGDVHVID